MAAMRFAVAAALSLATLSAAAAEQAVTMVSFKGECVKFTVGTISAKCSQILYMNFPNGRTIYNIVSADGRLPLGLSGGKDLQPSPNNYILLIDSLNNQGARTAAKGRCEMNGSTDGSLVHSLQCRADTEFGAVEIDFKGDGTPVKIDQIATEPKSSRRRR